MPRIYRLDRDPEGPKSHEAYFDYCRFCAPAKEKWFHHRKIPIDVYGGTWSMYEAHENDPDSLYRCEACKNILTGAD